MKVYVFGHDRDACIELANQLNEKGASALIAKENEGLKDVAGRIGKAFDRAVMVSTDSLGDSVSANRDTRIRAAVCYNQKTLRAAAASDINLFILEPDSYERLDITDILDGSPIRPQPPKEKEVPQPPRKEKEQRKPPVAAPPAPKAQRKEEDDDEADDSKDKGVGGRLKNIFGIEE